MQTPIQSPPLRMDQSIFAEERERLQRLQKRTHLLTAKQWQDGFTRLAPFRLLSSSTLGRGSFQSWQKANIFVAEKVQQNLAPNWDDILTINALLLEKEVGEIRRQEVFLGPHATCPAELLPGRITEFRKNVLENTHEDPLIKAALCQYVLVSLHPFADANGRTAVLIADWILALHEYLPMSFSSKLDAMIADVRRPSATAEYAVLKLLMNLQRSYQLVLDI